MAVGIKFDLKNPVQKNFLGNNAVYHGYAGMPDDSGRVYSEELCELEADRAKALGIRVTRTFYKWWAWDSKTDTWNWDNEVMTIFYKWLKRMKDRGIEVALNTGWCLPGDIVEVGGWNGKTPFKVEGDWTASVKRYADWVSETLYQLIEVRGFNNIKYIHLFTEPQYATVKFNYYFEGKHAYQLWLDCAKAVHEQLAADGRRNLVKIVGPNEGSTESSVMNKWVVEQGGAEYIDIFSSHNYQDFIMNDIYKGEVGNSLVFDCPGARVQQWVDLEPSKDYELELCLEVDFKDRLNVSGAIIIGAWASDKLDVNNSIQSGGQPTYRLNQTSTTLIDPSHLKEGKNTVGFTFNSGDAKECHIGVFSDIRGNNKLKLYSCTLKKCGSDENVLANPDFTKLDFGRGLFKITDPIEFIPRTWMFLACTKENVAADPYYHLLSCAKTTMSHLPKDKPVWFDEYNVRAERHSYHSAVHGTHLAASMQSLMNAGVQSSLMWTLFDQQWPGNHTNNDDCFVDGDHRCGVMPVLTRTLIPYPAYYSSALVIKYMGGEEGTKVYAGEGKDLLHATLSIMPDGNLSLLVINNKLKEDSFTVDFGENLGLTLNRFVYNPETIKPDETATLLSSDKSFEVGSALSDTIPGKAVAVYTTYKD